jgi:hypothetical protein
MAIKIFGKTIIGGEAQRKEATANEMAGKYPLSNDCDLMKSTIEAAKAELAQINASRPSTAGGKRIKSRQTNALRSWINEMQNFLKDLTCGILYTPKGMLLTSAPASAPSRPLFGLGPNRPENKTAVEPDGPVEERRGVLPVLGYTPGGPRGGAETPEEYVQPSIKCADGTFDVANGVNPPCATKGGVYMPSLPAPASAPTLPSGQSTVASSPRPPALGGKLSPFRRLNQKSTPPAPSTEYAALYDTAALGTEIAQTNAPAAPTKDDTQKYLMYGGIALVGVLVLNSLLNRD